MTRVWILLLSLLALPSIGAAQEEVDLGKGCKLCRLEGVKDCKRHGDRWLAAESEVLYCSVAAACKDCSGALLIDCKRCDGGPGNVELERRELRVQRLGEDVTPAQKLFERDLVRVITPHFDIIIDAHKLKDGSKRMDAHEVAHALAREAELAADMLDAHLGAKLHHYSRRARIWFWGDQKDHHMVNREVLGTNDPGAFKLFGPDPAYSCWTGEEGIKNAAMAVVSNGVHISTHLLMSNVFRTEWIGNKKAGWFDVGAAHWYEEHLFRRVSTYCIDEADARLDYENGQWRTAMRKYLIKNKQALLPPLVQKISGTLWDEEHALGWSLYDWIVATKPEAIKPFLMGFKNRELARDLVRKNLEMTIPQAEQAWRDWVMSTYPVKDPKPRKKL